MNRKTRVVATIGPASDGSEVLASMISGGLDVIRLNFSHGSREKHVETIRKIRRISGDLGINVAIMQDLCGPKIRVRGMAEGAVTLTAGAIIRIARGCIEGSSIEFGVTQEEWMDNAVQGDRILINDGAVELQVETPGSKIVCRVVRGGVLASGKGVNLPDTEVCLPSVTEKDMADLEAGIKEGVDFVALSFVRRAADLDPVRFRLHAAGSGIQLISKIEKPQAIANIDEIIAASDGVLVARGDLGVETALEEVPFLQKEVVRKANQQDKYVIVATQMLESMAASAVPTRAEVSDVANAILDGADAVMLSVETSTGRYPMESLEEMMRIAIRTDEYAAKHRPVWNWDEVNEKHRVLDAVGHSVRKLSEDLNPSAIVTFSHGGGTALFISKSRPACPVIAFTDSGEAARRMRIFRGVVPVVMDIQDADALAEKGRDYLFSHGLVRDGGVIIVVFDADTTTAGGADSIRVVTL